MNFYKRVHLLLKKQHLSDCQKKISFVQIMYLKHAILSPDDIKSCYQQPINCKIVLFLFEVNCEDIGISKLKSQLKLLPSSQFALGYHCLSCQKYPPSFCQGKSANYLSPPFLGNSPYILVLCESLPINRIFSEAA